VNQYVGICLAGAAVAAATSLIVKAIDRERLQWADGLLALFYAATWPVWAIVLLVALIVRISQRRGRG